MLLKLGCACINSESLLNKIILIIKIFVIFKAAFGSSILGMHSLECIPARMHFAENSAFGKILKLFIRSDYAEKNCVWLIF